MQDDATKERRISKNLGLSQLKNATVKPQILQESQEAGTPHHEMLPEEEVDGELVGSCRGGGTGLGLVFMGITMGNDV